MTLWDHPSWSPDVVVFRGRGRGRGVKVGTVELRIAVGVGGGQATMRVSAAASFLPNRGQSLSSRPILETSAINTSEIFAEVFRSKIVALVSTMSDFYLSAITSPWGGGQTPGCQLVITSAILVGAVRSIIRISKDYCTSGRGWNAKGEGGGGGEGRGLKREGIGVG